MPSFCLFNTINCKLILIKKYFHVNNNEWFYFFTTKQNIEKRRNKKINLLSNFVQSFYKDFLDSVDFSQDNNFQKQLVNNSLREDVKKGVGGGAHCRTHYSSNLYVEKHDFRWKE